MTVVEYIWLGGNNELRSKTRVLDSLDTVTIDGLVTTYITIDDIPSWNYDGSSTGQATGR